MTYETEETDENGQPLADDQSVNPGSTSGTQSMNQDNKHSVRICDSPTLDNKHSALSSTSGRATATATATAEQKSRAGTFSILQRWREEQDPVMARAGYECQKLELLHHSAECDMSLKQHQSELEQIEAQSTRPYHTAWINHGGTHYTLEYELNLGHSLTTQISIREHDFLPRRLLRSPGHYWVWIEMEWFSSSNHSRPYLDRHLSEDERKEIQRRFEFIETGNTATALHKLLRPCSWLLPDLWNLMLSYIHIRHWIVWHQFTFYRFELYAE